MTRRNAVFFVVMLMAGLASAHASAWAEDVLPAPSSSRIVLHSIGCSLDGSQGCPEDRAVFDEAAASVGASSLPVALQLAEQEEDYVQCGRGPVGVELLRTCLVASGLGHQAKN